MVLPHKFIDLATQLTPDATRPRRPPRPSSPQWATSLSLRSATATGRRRLGHIALTGDRRPLFSRPLLFDRSTPSLWSHKKEEAKKGEFLGNLVFELFIN
jgi:hypothetical protein